MRILTLNTWGTRGPQERRVVLLEVLKTLRPDVLCLQEVTDPSLLDALPYPMRAYAASGSLAVLSRFPTKDRREITYKTISLLEPHRRQALLTEITVGSDSLWVVTTHLAWKAEDEASRVSQVEELLQWIQPLGDRILLAGDFNAEPSSPPIRQIVEAGFTDLFAYLRPQDPGITWDNRNPFIQSHEVKFPDRRIDYLFLHEKALTGLKPTQCEVVGRIPTAEGLFPSDHYGVLATLGVRPQGV